MKVRLQTKLTFFNYYIALRFANDGKIAKGQGCKLFFIVFLIKILRIMASTNAKQLGISRKKVK